MKRLSPVSYSTPVIWQIGPGKQVVTAGHARMIAYDLKDGKEKWSIAGIPSGCCSSPIIADGYLFFSGSGGGEDAENQMPSYDSLLKDLDTDKNGSLSREEAEKKFAGFFDNQDSNKDGNLSRDEWDSTMRLYNEGRSSAFALKAAETGEVGESNMLWKKTKGLPYIPTALMYRGQYVMVKDGGIVTALDAKTGHEVYQARVAAPGTYYASPVAANGHIYVTSLDEGVITVLKAGSEKPEVVATNPKLGEKISATPAIADNTLYVRTDKHLYAFAD
jgi:outer membrane protein assembly factor BamB